MIPSITVDDRQAIAWFDELPGAVHDALKKKISLDALQLESHIKADKLSGQILHVRTGALRRSIFSDVTEGRDQIIGRAASSGDVKYAAIQEFGGKTSPHEIVARKAMALHWVSNGKDFFARVVHHPGSVIPERSYMRSALADLAPQFIEGMKATVAKVMHR